VCLGCNQTSSFERGTLDFRCLLPSCIRFCAQLSSSNCLCEAFVVNDEKPLTRVLEKASRKAPRAPVSNSRLIFRICLGSSGYGTPGKAALLRVVRALHSLRHPRRMCGLRGGGQHTHLVSHSIAILSKASKRTHSLHQHRLVRAVLTRSFVLSGCHQQGPAGQHRILDLIPCLSNP
jgi:hypothetical protein